MAYSEQALDYLAGCLKAAIPECTGVAAVATASAVPLEQQGELARVIEDNRGIYGYVRLNGAVVYSAPAAEIMTGPQGTRLLLPLRFVLICPGETELTAEELARSALLQAELCSCQSGVRGGALRLLRAYTSLDEVYKQETGKVLDSPANIAAVAVDFEFGYLWPRASRLTYNPNL